MVSGRRVAKAVAGAGLAGSLVLLGPGVPAGATDSNVSYDSGSCTIHEVISGATVTITPLTYNCAIALSEVYCYTAAIAPAADATNYSAVRYGHGASVPPGPGGGPSVNGDTVTCPTGLQPVGVGGSSASAGPLYSVSMNDHAK